MKIYSILIGLLIMFSACQQNKQSSIFIEAESFDEKGGWVIDQQSMDVMGSPYLMAHGMGVIVDDASVQIEVSIAGDYNLFVRTMNWVAKWDVSGSPGKFELLINNKPCQTVFGTEGADWHWQKGEKVHLEKGSNTITLHDLTGFNGRCDAIYLSLDEEDLPNDNKELSEFRKEKLGLPKQTELAGEYDLVVIGGGTAGICSAVSAARNGLKVALIQDRPVPGGNNSSEVRVHIMGDILLPPYPNLGNVVKEIDENRLGNAQSAENYNDEKKIKVLENEENIDLFFNYHAIGVNKEGDNIKSVIAKNIESSKELLFVAPLFVDCTGDGSIGFLAGADFRMGREAKSETEEESALEFADQMTMGTSVQWYSVRTKTPVDFPDCPWALSFNEKTVQVTDWGEWDWETGMNLDQIYDFEEIRDYAFRVVYGNWAYLKNQYAEKEEYSKRKLGWVAYIGGKRESRRLLGDVILKEQDVVDQKEYADACVTATWSIDLHYPDSLNAIQFPNGPFRSIAVHGHKDHYAIPYRCLYSRNVDNLFMAGRNISVTHVALGTVRVMGTTGMMGEVVGMAAKICNENNALPKDVYQKYLKELIVMMEKGI